MSTRTYPLDGPLAKRTVSSPAPVQRNALCPPCAEKIMSLVGESSPWHADGRTVVLPDTFDEMTTRLFAYTR